MSIEFLITSLFFVSLFTGLTVEAVKKILDDKKVTYSTNALAAIISVVISIISSICYIVIAEINVTGIVVVEMIVLVFLSFLVSTVGYDKVIQTIRQAITKDTDKKE